MTMEHPRPVIAGRADIEGLQLLESCAYTWIFDGAILLSRRMPRDATVDLDVPAAWTPYHQLEVDGARSCFVVTLDEGRTRMLRASLRTDPCSRCHGGADRVPGVVLNRPDLVCADPGEGGGHNG